MHYSIIQLFEQLAPLKKKEKELIMQKFNIKKLKKGEFFLQAGKINTHIGFINSGLVRYFVLKNGEESTFEFTKEGEFIADYQSFTKKVKSDQFIQAIEDCELLIINYEDTQEIFNQTANGNLIGRKVVEHRFDVMVQQLLSIYMHGPQERYQQFMSKYSELSQRIPQYLIASYIGIQPESLSRIRNRYAKGLS